MVFSVMMRRVCTGAGVVFLACGSLLGQSSVTSPAIAKMERLATSAEARAVTVASAADAAIDRAAARGQANAAIAQAERARATVRTLGDRASAGIERSRAATARRLASAEGNETSLAIINLAANRLQVRVDEHVESCLADIDQSLEDAGISTP